MGILICLGKFIWKLSLKIGFLDIMIFSEPISSHAKVSFFWFSWSLFYSIDNIVVCFQGHLSWLFNFWKITQISHQRCGLYLECFIQTVSNLNILLLIAFMIIAKDFMPIWLRTFLLPSLALECLHELRGQS